MIRKLFLMISLLAISSQLYGIDCVTEFKNKWGNYILKDSENNAVNITEFLYRSNCQGEVYFFKYISENDLIILEKRIKQNNFDAFIIAMILKQYSDGFSASLISSMIGNFLKINPIKFLQAFNVNTNDVVLEKILCNFGPKFYDKELPERVKEAAERINILRKVKDKELLELRNKCIQIIYNCYSDEGKLPELDNDELFDNKPIEFTIKVTSERFDKKNRYSFKNLTDKNKNTTWVAGGSNSGINEKVTITLKSKKYVKAIRILNGFQINNALFYDNSMVKILKLIFNGKEKKVELKNSMNWQRIPVYDKIDTIELIIVNIYEGNKYPEDTCISELEIESE